MRFNSMTRGMGWLNGTDLVPNGMITLDSNVIATNNSANCSRGRLAVQRGRVRAARAAAPSRPPAFLTPPQDLHLKSGAAALGVGNPTSYPATDIDGDSRPAGVRPDAGAGRSRLIHLY